MHHQQHEENSSQRRALTGVVRSTSSVRFSDSVCMCGVCELHFPAAPRIIIATPGIAKNNIYVSRQLLLSGRFGRNNTRSAPARQIHLTARKAQIIYIHFVTLKTPRLVQQRHFGVVRLVQNQTGFARRIVTFQFDDNTRVSRSERKSEIARKRISVCAEILRASAVGYLANCVFSLWKRTRRFAKFERSCIYYPLTCEWICGDDKC